MCFPVGCVRLPDHKAIQCLHFPMASLHYFSGKDGLLLGSQCFKHGWTSEACTSLPAESVRYEPTCPLLGKFMVWPLASDRSQLVDSSLTQAWTPRCASFHSPPFIWLPLLTSLLHLLHFPGHPLSPEPPHVDSSPLHGWVSPQGGL